MREMILGDHEQPLEGSILNHRVHGGEFEKVVVLIHGMNSSIATWDFIGPQLAKDYKVIVYDQRGHGASPDIGKIYSNSTMALDLAKLLDYLRVDRAHIIGHSLGGRTAIKFAALFPERVEKMVIEDMHIDANPMVVAENLEAVEQLRKLPKTFASPEEALVHLKRIYTGEYESWAEELVESKLVQVGDHWEFTFRPYVGELYETYGLGEDLGPTLAQVRAPTFVLQADPELLPILTPAKADRLRQVKADARITVVQGADHSIHLTRPREYLRLVREFLGTPPAGDIDGLQ